MRRACEYTHDSVSCMYRKSRVHNRCLTNIMEITDACDIKMRATGRDSTPVIVCNAENVEFLIAWCVHHSREKCDCDYFRHASCTFSVYNDY